MRRATPWVCEQIPQCPQPPPETMGATYIQLKTQVCQTFEDLENTWEGGACVDTPHIDKCTEKNWPNIVLMEKLKI